ncbi:response regulator transcription factor [Diplocloster modestus]|uniref:Stage 0 sporulation protein A homolog n=1 Tax=Diplocloster modestus TaxID=2850322 RepID=A0ABS6K8B0_9FIRM|nr:response regulator [Diplocloster modestus]MBU9726753.1 response regulator [Diplocloster modestus]
MERLKGWRTVLKILIADDEDRVCRLIEKLIDWEHLDISLVATAANGIEELELIQKYEPDIVITDIRMPGMDGLQVIERVVQMERPVNFIVVSGYKQFEYAYNALKYGVEDYLLKPIHKEELNKILAKICAARLEKEKQVSDYELMEKEHKLSQEIIQNKFIATLLTQENRDVVDLAMANEKYHFSFSGPVYQCYALSIDYERVEDVEKETAEGLYRTVLKKMRKFLEEAEATGQNVNGLIHNVIAGICEFRDGGTKEGVLQQEVWNQLFEEIQKYSSSFSGYAVTMTVSAPFCDFSECVDRLRDTFEHLGSRLVLGANQVIRITEAGLSKEDPALIVNMKCEDSIKAAVEAQDLKRFDYLLRECFRMIGNEKPESYRVYYKNVEQLIRVVFEAVDFDEISDTELETEKEDLYSQIRKYADKSSIRNYVLEYLNAFLKKYEASKRNQEKKPVRIVKDYIREHYQENISLEEMAKLVDLNPVYLSVLFKRSTGVNFNDYLTNIRITKAKTMLKDTNESIAVIAEEVGYANAKYFSQLFSKVVGINPTVYRKLHS